MRGEQLREGVELLPAAGVLSCGFLYLCYWEHWLQEREFDELCATVTANGGYHWLMISTHSCR